MAETSTKWEWIPREVEHETLRALQHNFKRGCPTWLYLRGRHGTGKSSTITKVLQQHCGQDQLKGCCVELKDDDLSALNALIGCRDATSVIAAVDGMEARIHAGHFIVLEGIHRAALGLRQSLQAMIRRIDRASFLNGARVTGRLVVLGAGSVAAETVLTEAGASLFRRMETEPSTILPFLPNEMAVVYKRFAVVSSTQKLYIWLLTGCYPNLLKKLADTGLLCDNADPIEMIHELLKPNPSSVDFLASDEFSSSWRNIAQLAVESKLSRQEVITKLVPSGDSTERFVAEINLGDLVGKYGVLEYVDPIIPGLKHEGATGSTHTPLDTGKFVIRDPRWYWYHELYQCPEAIESTIDGSQSNDLLVAPANNTKALLDAIISRGFMQRVVVENVQARARCNIPVFPAWKYRDTSAFQLGDPVMWDDRYSDVKSAPFFIVGSFMDDVDGTDYICIFTAERHVVHISSKASPDVLCAYELDACTSDNPQTRTQHRIASLQRRLQVLRPPAGGAASGTTRGATEEIIDMLCAPSATSYVYVTCGMTHATAEMFWNRIPESARGDTWFADLNDFMVFPPMEVPSRYQTPCQYPCPPVSQLLWPAPSAVLSAALRPRR
jgi:hypothetical protein